MAEAVPPQGEREPDDSLDSAAAAIAELGDSFHHDEDETPAPADGESHPPVTEPDSETKPEATEPAAQPAEAEPFTLAKLAETIGAESAEYLEGLVHVQGPDGKPIALGEALKQWRTGPPDAAQTAATIAQIQQVRQAEVAQYQDAMMRVQALTQELFKQVEHEDRSVDWHRLREEDPNQYLLKRQELEDRRRVAGQALIEMRAAQDRAMQEQHGQIEQIKQAHMAMLLDQRPEWRDPARARAEVGELRTHLLANGWQESEVDNLVDHRVILALWDAYQFRNVRATAKKKITELRRLPKTVTPGARREPGAVSAEDRRKRWERLERSGSARDAAALLEGKV